MKIMFMGTPDFAVRSLEKIAEKHEVVCVVSQPDKPRGRGHKLCPTPVKEAAEKLGIDLVQPVTLKDGAFQDTLDEYQPDVIVVVAYGRILPEYILNYPKLGCINVHASLLPKYRGAAPIQWAVINGDKKSGVCTMQMEKGLDTGAVYECDETEIGEYETAGELWDRLAEMGGRLIVSTLDKLPDIQAVKQSEMGSSYAPMLTKEDARIDWTASARVVANHIHGMNPAPVAFTTYNGETLKIYRVTLSNGNLAPGQIGQVVKKKGLEVGCGDGSVFITELQPSGGKRMNAEDYLRGHKLEGFFE